MKNYIFVLLYLLVPFLPYFGTIDKIGFQWFYISLLNIFFFLIQIRNQNYFLFFRSISKFIFVKSYFLFISISFISIFYAYNLTLSLVDFSRLVSTFFIFFNLSFLFHKHKFPFKYFIYSIFLIQLLLLLSSLFPLIDFVLHNSIDNINFNTLPRALKGSTGNKNILASALAFNIPIVCFLLFNNKLISHIIAFFTLSSSFILLIFLSSKASIISSTFFISVLVIFLLFSYKKYKLPPLLTLIFSVIPAFIFNLSLPSNKALVSQIQTLSQSTDSVNVRVILWENALDFIGQNLFIGCGIGNWKVESLPYWRERLTGYTVPYHAHNDFLELSAETGILGGLSYFLIFVFIFGYLFFSFLKTKSHIYMLLFGCLVVYFFDAFVNFPIERAISQVNFALLLFLSFYFLSYEKYHK